MMSYQYPHPISRTYRYKKITKPALERKRRARMNKCVDELKILMVDALEAEGENISKLEKAEILELTVRHVQRLHATQGSGFLSAPPKADATAESRWQSGFGHCAAEACRYLAALPGESGEELAKHLASGLESTRKLNIPIVSDDDLPSPTPGISPQLAQSQCIPLSAQMASLSVVSPQCVSPSSSLPPPEAPNQPCNSLEKCEQAMQLDDEDDVEEEIDVEGVEDRDPMWRPW